MNSKRPGGLSRILLAAVGAAAGLAATERLITRSARQAERANPATGRFLSVQGVKLHYLERGSGPPIVLIHGNGVMAHDWEVSGIFGALAADHRVIAFDRPGFGYSDRPRNAQWTPAQQAELLHLALLQLGIERYVIIGHSWGTLVALAMALDFPADVERLVLLSGYYFASPRLDALLAAVPASPILGDVLRHTVTPMIGRLMSPMVIHELFAPAAVPDRFKKYPLSMSLRPSQLRASAQEAQLMASAAAALEPRYGDLRVPVSIIAGSGDRVADPFAQSNRLANLVLGHDAELIAGAGHMVHYFSGESVLRAATSPATAPHQRKEDGGGSGAALRDMR